MTTTTCPNMSDELCVGPALKHLASLSSAALLVIALTGSAQSCPLVPNLLVPNREVAQRLKDGGFPLALLRKAHVAEFAHYGDFLQRKWGFGPDEDWSIYATRQLDNEHWETVIFSAFGFPSHAIAVAEIADRISLEARVGDNPDLEI